MRLQRLMAQVVVNTLITGLRHLSKSLNKSLWFPPHIQPGVRLPFPLLTPQEEEPDDGGEALHQVQEGRQH